MEGTQQGLFDGYDDTKLKHYLDEYGAETNRGKILRYFGTIRGWWINIIEIDKVFCTPGSRLFIGRSSTVDRTMRKLRPLGLLESKKDPNRNNRTNCWRMPERIF